MAFACTISLFLSYKEHSQLIEMTISLVWSTDFIEKHSKHPTLNFYYMQSFG